MKNTLQNAQVSYDNNDDDNNDNNDDDNNNGSDNINNKNYQNINSDNDNNNHNNNHNNNNSNNNNNNNNDDKIHNHLSVLCQQDSAFNLRQLILLTLLECPISPTLASQKSLRRTLLPYQIGCQPEGLREL